MTTHTVVAIALGVAISTGTVAFLEWRTRSTQSAKVDYELYVFRDKSISKDLDLAVLRNEILAYIDCHKLKLDQEIRITLTLQYIEGRIHEQKNKV